MAKRKQRPSRSNREKLISGIYITKDQIRYKNDGNPRVVYNEYQTLEEQRKGLARNLKIGEIVGMPEWLRNPLNYPERFGTASQVDKSPRHSSRRKELLRKLFEQGVQFDPGQEQLIRYRERL